jgi:hypothetical protein
MWFTQYIRPFLKFVITNCYFVFIPTIKEVYKVFEIVVIYDYWICFRNKSSDSNSSKVKSNMSSMDFDCII